MKPKDSKPKKEKKLSPTEAFRAAAAQQGLLPPQQAPQAAPPPVPAKEAPPAPAKQAAPAAKSKQKQKQAPAPAAPPEAKQPAGQPPTAPDAAQGKKGKKKQPKSDMPRIEQIRRRKSEKRLRRAVLAVLVLTGIFLYLGGVFAGSINFFGDLLDTAKITLLPGDGWPAALDIDGLVDAKPLGGGVALCGKSELQLYSPTAKPLRTVQHGYAEPAMVTGNARVCVYNRGGKELRVESRSRTLATKSYDYPILTVGMSPGGTMAVATKAERYLAAITVYSPTFDEVYYAYLAENYPLALAVSQDGKHLAVACMQVANGSFGTRLLLYDMTKSDTEAGQAAVDIADNAPLQLHYLPTGELVVVCDGFTGIYNTETGQQVARYDYGGRSLLAADGYGKNTLLVFDTAGSSTASSCVLLGETLQQLAVVSPGVDVQDVALGAEYFYALGKKAAVGYTLAGEEVDRQVLPAEGMKIVPGKAAFAITAKEILQFTPLNSK
jgi:hypothetical protein